MSQTHTNSCCDSGKAPCPECGGLKCLCRPRFFAGQLLTEQDLNRLDRYIQEKNRLHNRYLHGWGVVCGLEVSCLPCDAGSVGVSPGYALSPCGDDIIVCKEDRVDICKLIKACRQAERLDCRPYADKNHCREAEEQWVLAISYLEKPSRGVTALKGSGCRDSGNGSCGCGGAHCDCGCGHAEVQKTRSAPEQCEPTLTCEGYRYEVFKLPKEAGDTKGRDPYGLSGKFGYSSDKGEMFDRILCCIQPLFDLVKQGTAAMNNAKSRQAKYQVCCRIKKDLRAYIAELSIQHCQIFKQLDNLVCPDPELDESAFNKLMDEAGEQFLAIVWQVVLQCLCKALLPPCPGAAGDTRVPLAVVTVTGGDCRVVQVCNWTVLRKFVVTFPNLQYWFSWIPYVRLLRKLIEYLCCSFAGLKDEFQYVREKKSDDQGMAASGKSSLGNVQVQPVLQEKYAAMNLDFSEIVFRSYQRNAEAMTLKTVMGGLSGADDKTDYTRAEQENSLQFILLNMLGKPLLNSAIPGVEPFAGGLSAGGKTEAFVDLGGAGGVKEEMNELKKRLDKQDLIIDQLMAKLAGNP
ncbi:MAG: hypothetical protein ACU826_01485 [Gammaproteobacteria bacterium]